MLSPFGSGSDVRTESTASCGGLPRVQTETAFPMNAPTSRRSPNCRRPERVHGIHRS